MYKRQDKSASLINAVEALKENDPESEMPTPHGAGEIRRLKELAQTAFEEGCMWVVKAATFYTKGKKNG